MCPEPLKLCGCLGWLYNIILFFIWLIHYLLHHFIICMQLMTQVSLILFKPSSVSSSVKVSTFWKTGQKPLDLKSLCQSLMASEPSCCYPVENNRPQDFQMSSFLWYPLFLQNLNSQGKPSLPLQTFSTASW